MKRYFTDDNFEDFLRQSADGLRMRPSDKVWQGISKNLHPPKQRKGWITGGLLLAFCLSGYFIADHAGLNRTATQKQNTVSLTAGSASALPGTSATAGTDRTTRNPQMAASDTRGRSSITSLQIGTGLTDNATTGITGTNAIPGFVPTIVDSYTEESTSTHTAAAEKKEQAAEPKFPLTIESVTNSFKPLFKKKKLAWEFYVTPTISYRKLSENKSFLRSSSDLSLAARSTATHSVNSAVTHKPNLGLEAGVAAKIPVSNKLKLRAGMQVNVTRYDIKAYNSSSELATIMLNVSNNSVDSLNTVTGLSNTDGYQSDWLQNLYFQISAPIGVEYMIGGNKKVKFGVATTIQPTYILGDRAYLISIDYKNYAEIPDLTRRWNVNTSLETFVNYSTGKLSWQVGPQVRYQLLSSFISKHPVKENLFDFGLRVGLSIAK